MRALAWMCAALLGIVVPISTLSAAPLPEAIRTTQREFSIPFDVEGLNVPGSLPLEVQLHVSDDGGRTWTLNAAVPANRGSFRYLAPQEGEYWFAVRTKGTDGKLWPEVFAGPEMRVIVEPVHPLEQVRSDFPASRLPSNAHPRLVNSHDFELDYDAETTGPVAATKVELWWTGDGGRTWCRFGLDDDSQSPMLVHVDRDGLYGVWLVMDRAAGVRGESPRPGEVPQAWVSVDTIAPQARLLTAELNGTESGTALTVRWEATDKALAERPISLLGSPSPQGPWTVLASEVENLGSHTCSLMEKVPRRLFLRLEVRDQAGNLQRIQPTEPVSLVYSQARSTGTDYGDLNSGSRVYQVFR